MRLAMRPQMMTPLQLTYITMRPFAHTKYSFDDEDWKPNVFQVSCNRNQMRGQT